MSDGTRTRGRRDHNPELYQLSYAHQARRKSSGGISCPNGVSAARDLGRGAGGEGVAHPEALPLWGGTDVMVEINFGRARPEAILDLTRVDELTRWDRDNGSLRVGAGVTYTRAIEELGDALPGPGDRVADGRLAADPQPRDDRRQPRLLLPAGDALPPLYASRRRGGGRARRAARDEIAIEDFITGPKRNVLEPDELIAAFHMPAARGRPAVREDRHPQRDGDRGLLVRDLRSTTTRARSAPASARPPPRRAARTRRRRSSPASSTGTGAATIERGGARPLRSSSSPRPPPRSTTSAAARPTGATRWP